MMARARRSDYALTRPSRRQSGVSHTRSCGPVVKSDWKSRCRGGSWGTECKVVQIRQGSGGMAIGPSKPMPWVAAGWQVVDGADSVGIRPEQFDDCVNPLLVTGFGDTAGTAPCREDVVTAVENVGNDGIVPGACSAPDAMIGEVSGKVGWVRGTQCEKIEHCELTGAREALEDISLDASDRVVGVHRVGGTGVLEHNGHKLIALAVAPEGNVKRVAVGAVSREARADTADINVFVVGDLTTKARHWTVASVGCSSGSKNGARGIKAQLSLTLTAWREPAQEPRPAWAHRRIGTTERLQAHHGLTEQLPGMNALPFSRSTSCTPAT